VPAVVVRNARFCRLCEVVTPALIDFPYPLRTTMSGKVASRNTESLPHLERVPPYQVQGFFLSRRLRTCTSSCLILLRSLSQSGTRSWLTQLVAVAVGFANRKIIALFSLRGLHAPVRLIGRRRQRRLLGVRLIGRLRERWLLGTLRVRRCSWIRQRRFERFFCVGGRVVGHDMAPGKWIEGW
jgi:hypothetical protein